MRRRTGRLRGHICSSQVAALALRQAGLTRDRDTNLNFGPARQGGRGTDRSTQGQVLPGHPQAATVTNRDSKRS